MPPVIIADVKYAGLEFFLKVFVDFDILLVSV